MVYAGVTRSSSFPQIGEKQFMHNRMVEAILREKGYEVHVVSLGIAVLPEGIHVFKHIPLTPLYSEETMLQACCSYHCSTQLHGKIAAKPPQKQKCCRTSARDTALYIV